MLVEDLSRGDSRAIFVGGVRHDLAVSREYFAMREPRSAVARAPPRIGQPVLQAPKFKNGEMASDCLMVEELQGLALDARFRREDVAFILDAKIFIGDQAA